LRKKVITKYLLKKLKKYGNKKVFSKVVMECVEQNKLSNLSEKERREMFLKIRDEIIKKKSK
jgi:hypothetical protein